MSVSFYNGLESYPARARQQDAVVTVGTFDGIHRGHQAIFKAVQTEARKSSLDPVLVTFEPHPRTVVTPESVPMLLTTREEKAEFVPHFFSGKVLILTFDEQLKNMSASEFVQEILVERIGTRKLIVGYDHAVGTNRSGDTDELARLGARHGFEVEVVSPVLYGGEAVSSSRIRTAITKGRFSEALDLFGHDYAVFGSVERGIGLGRKLGYPTANIAYGNRKLLPSEGVYACWLQLEKELFHGMMFIGKNHFNPAKRITVEVNIFDFDRDIYDQQLTVFPTHYVRANRKFTNTDALVEQIVLDKIEVKNIIEKEKKYVLHKGEKSSNYC